ncbi:hypothetical protein HK104_000974 [Borealophlyctis nickersoniae]|nr:hypothetical protein HK104_000974 [Borealophlyctis nickersoniae]
MEHEISPPPDATGPAYDSEPSVDDNHETSYSDVLIEYDADDETGHGAGNYGSHCEELMAYEDDEEFEGQIGQAVGSDGGDTAEKVFADGGSMSPPTGVVAGAASIGNGDVGDEIDQSIVEKKLEEGDGRGERMVETVTDDDGREEIPNDESLLRAEYGDAHLQEHEQEQAEFLAEGDGDQSPHDLASTSYIVVSDGDESSGPSSSPNRTIVTTTVPTVTAAHTHYGEGDGASAGGFEVVEGVGGDHGDAGGDVGGMWDLPCVLLYFKEDIFAMFKKWDNPSVPAEQSPIFEDEETGYKVFEKPLTFCIAALKRMFNIENDVVIEFPQLDISLHEAMVHTRNLNFETIYDWFEAVMIQEEKQDTLRMLMIEVINSVLRYHVSANEKLKYFITQQSKSIPRRIRALNNLSILAREGGLSTNPIVINSDEEDDYANDIGKGEDDKQHEGDDQHYEVDGGAVRAETEPYEIPEEYPSQDDNEIADPNEEVHLAAGDVRSEGAEFPDMPISAVESNDAASGIRDADSASVVSDSQAGSKRGGEAEDREEEAKRVKV